MAAEPVHFIYTGGGQEAIPDGATHVSIDDSITVIPADLFSCHKNIVELICHEGVERIEGYAFYTCRRLKRVIIPGVKIIGKYVFSFSLVLTDVECPKLERIGDCAFTFCKSLSIINLQAVKVVGDTAFAHTALTDVDFGSNLESIEVHAFYNCSSLERLTIPLKERLINSCTTFTMCSKLKHMDLVERAVLNETVAALQSEKWRVSMKKEIDSINQSLPLASAGSGDFSINVAGEKTRVIREWMGRVLHKIVSYKAQHRRVLNEAASTFQHVLPNDIVTKNVMSFLELPSHTFEGEDDGSDESQ